jgi:hypothetical protein
MITRLRRVGWRSRRLSATSVATRAHCVADAERGERIQPPRPTTRPPIGGHDIQWIGSLANASSDQYPIAVRVADNTPGGVPC